MLVKINEIIKDMMNNTTQSLNLHEIPFPNSNGHSAISVPTYLPGTHTYLPSANTKCAGERCSAYWWRCEMSSILACMLGPTILGSSKYILLV